MAKFLSDWRNPTLVVTIACTLIFGFGWLSSVPSTVITVGSHDISERDVVKELKEQAGFQVVGSLVTTAILQEYATSKGITVSEAEIDQLQQIQERQLEMPPSNSSLDEYLKQNGQTLESFRRQLYRQALQTKVLVTEDEMKAAVATVAKTGKPPFTVPPRFKYRFFTFADAAAANTAIAELEAGTPESLAAAAAESLDAAMASRDQIFFPGMMGSNNAEKFLSSALAKLKPGECSQPLKIPGNAAIVGVFLLRSYEPAVKPTYENSNIAAGYSYMMANGDKFIARLHAIEGQVLSKVDIQFMHTDYDAIKKNFEEIKKRNPQLPSPRATPGASQTPAGSAQ